MSSVVKCLYRNVTFNVSDARDNEQNCAFYSSCSWKRSFQSLHTTKAIWRKRLFTGQQNRTGSLHAPRVKTTLFGFKVLLNQTQDVRFERTIMHTLLDHKDGH